MHPEAAVLGSLPHENDCWYGVGSSSTAGVMRPCRLCGILFCCSILVCIEGGSVCGTYVVLYLVCSVMTGVSLARVCLCVAPLAGRGTCLLLGGHLTLVCTSLDHTGGFVQAWVLLSCVWYDVVSLTA